MVRKPSSLPGAPGREEKKGGRALKNRKRFLSLLLCAALLAALAVPASAVFEPTASAPTLRVSSVTAAPGEEVELSLRIENNPGIIAASLELNYDREKLELIGVTDKKLLPNGVFSDRLTTYPFILFWEASTASANVTANGELAALRFKVKESCAAGQTARVWLSYDPDNIYDYALHNVSFTCADGGVTVAAASGYAVTVENRTGGLASVSLASGRYSGSKSFTVTCPKACTVLVKSGASYTVLTPGGSGGTRSFTVNVTKALTVVVALKGDVDGNGSVTVSDAAAVNRSLLSPTARAYKALTAEQSKIADVDGNGSVSLSDASFIRRSILSTTARAYKALIW